MEANTEKRQAFQEIIESISEEISVYIDESGIEEDTYKEHSWSKIGEVIPA